ncbi:MAG: hypothetical protein ACK533_11995, partial [Planctomycetota bacterium]
AADAPAPPGVVAIGHDEPGDPPAAAAGFADLRATAAARGGALVGLVGAPAALAGAVVADAARTLAVGDVPVLAADSLPTGEAVAFAVPAASVRRAVTLLHDRFCFGAA